MKLIRSIALVTLLAWSSGAVAQAPITSPVSQFGRAMGDDYFLANYTQLVDYWKKLDRESDRLTLEEIGKTAEGRPVDCPRRGINRGVGHRLIGGDGPVETAIHIIGITRF